MEKFFLLNNIDSRILHPITLNFIDEEISNLYIENVLDYFYHY